MRHNTTTTQSPQNKKVGVVIPIYNVAEYLRECLDSVINQTYKNLSIVLVNDGSTDNNESLDIAKGYVAKDSRFILIDKENGGQSTARNVGIAWFSQHYETRLDSSNTKQNPNTINHMNNNIGGGGGVTLYSYNITNENPYNIYKIYASSIHATQHTKSTHNINTTNNHNSTLQPQQIDYIIFLDSDDYWKPYCIEECIKHSDGVDIVWFDYELYFDGIETRNEDKHSIFEPYQSSNNVITQQDWLQGFVHSKQICFSNVCLTLINFYFFKSIRLTFVDYAIYEDVNFGTLLFLQSQKIFLLQQPFYTYRMRKNSTTNTTKNTSVPHYIKHIYDTFKDKQVMRKYHTCSSWFLMLLEFMEFINANPSKLDDKAKQKFLSPYIEPSCHLLSFKHDPLNLIPKLIILEPYLDKKFKWRDRLRITNQTKYNRLKPLFNIYDSIKGIERTIRKVFKKEKD